MQHLAEFSVNTEYGIDHVVGEVERDEVVQDGESVGDGNKKIRRQVKVDKGDEVR